MTEGERLKEIEEFRKVWPNADFGPAHIVVADDNVENAHVQWCLGMVEAIRQARVEQTRGRVSAYAKHSDAELLATQRLLSSMLGVDRGSAVLLERGAATIQPAATWRDVQDEHLEDAKYGPFGRDPERPQLTSEQQRQSAAYIAASLSLMSPERKAQVIEETVSDLRARLESANTLEIERRVGVDSWPNHRTSHIDRAQNGTYTVAVKVNGGATDRELDQPPGGAPGDR